MAESSPLAHSPTLLSTPRTGDEPLAAGTSVGEFRVERFLGAGAMGEVYAGIHPVIGKKVAIKVLRREASASPDGVERFKREARAANQIDHPHVIDIFSFGRLDDGRLYLVMDLVEGRSLRAVLLEGPLDVPTALDVLAAVADALDAAHGKGVVHRDLKPDNVMLATGTPAAVYVLDFGLAKLLSAADAPAPATQLTGKGTWLGTPAYMAPEQWSADGAGPASDRYALGVMAFELLSGSLPFQAASLPQLMEQHFRAKVPTLSSRGAAPASSAFDPILRRAMAKDPDTRFASAREMIEGLRAAAAPGRPRPGAPRSWRPYGPAIAGAGVLGLAFVAVLAVRAEPEAVHDGDRRAAAPVSGMVRIAILSNPVGAEVHRDGALIGLTPAKFELAPASSLAFEVKKPGYVTARHAMTVPDEDAVLPPFTLAAITGFEGVWALPSGALRAFTRTGDRVEVSKLQSADGEREFYRHFELAPSETGVAFTSTEAVIDPALPNAPSCHVPHTTAYHYEPATDTLTVRQQQVTHDVVEGRCIIKASTFTAPITLIRADRASRTERETLAPVGKPVNRDKRAMPVDVSPRARKKSATKIRPEPKSPREPVQVQKQTPDLGLVPNEVGEPRAPAQQNAPRPAIPEPRGDNQGELPAQQSSPPQQN